MINAMRYTKSLEESGFTEKQANTAIKVVSDIMENNFATKQDIQIASLELRGEMKEINAELRAEIAELRAELRSEMKELRLEMISMQDKIVIKLSGVMIVLMGAMIAAQKLL